MTRSDLRAAAAALVFAVGGCATAPIEPAAPPESAPVVSPAPARSGYGAVIARAGRADAPQLTQVVQTLGEADIVNREGVGALLTYRSESCALVLIFTEDRLSEAQAMPRRAGEAAPTLDDCVEAVYARRRAG